MTSYKTVSHRRDWISRAGDLFFSAISFLFLLTFSFVLIFLLRESCLELSKLRLLLLFSWPPHVRFFSSDNLNSLYRSYDLSNVLLSLDHCWSLSLATVWKANNVLLTALIRLFIPHRFILNLYLKGLSELFLCFVGLTRDLILFLFIFSPEFSVHHSVYTETNVNGRVK